MKAVILVGHGSRTEKGNQDFIRFAIKVKKAINVPIHGFAFLEKASPSIPEAINKCVNQGATAITILPILLLPGTHANVDIPFEMERAKRQFPQVSFHYANPIGVDEVMVKIIKKRLTEKKFENQADEQVLLIGHGSREGQAAIEFEQIATLTRKSIQSKVEIGYLKGNSSYREVLQNQVKASTNKIYIVPYLLLSGGFTVQIEQFVCKKSLQYSNIDMILCNPIGFDDALIELLCKRMKEVNHSQSFHWKGTDVHERVLSTSY